MKCRCPACGRSTEIEAELVDFLARCQRCGVLLRARTSQLTEEATGEAKSQTVVKVVSTGRHGYVREETAANGKIADLLSRPRVPKQGSAAAAMAPVESANAAAEAPALPRLIPGASKRKLSAAEWRRTQLRERHQMLGIVGIAGIIGLGLCAVMTIGAIAMRTGHLFLRAVRADGDIVRTDATNP